MNGRVSGLTMNTSKTGKKYATMTINGVEGSSFDTHFFDKEGKMVDYDTEERDGYIIFKWVGEVNEEVVFAKASLAAKALECAVQRANGVGSEVKSDALLNIADTYLNWLLSKSV